MRYNERLALAGIDPSVGRRGDSYDNALAETIIGLYRTKLIRTRGPWRSLDQSKSSRSNGSGGSTAAASSDPLGFVPPAEFETQYRSRLTAQLEHIRLKSINLR